MLILILTIITIIRILGLARIALFIMYNYGDINWKAVQVRIVLALVGEASSLLILGGGLSIFGIVGFAVYAQYVFALPYVVVGVPALISFFVLRVVRDTRKKREARTTPDHEAIRTALEAGRVSEAMRLYKAVNCLDADNVKPALQQVLANWPIKEAIYEATSELLALQRNSSIALAAGVPQNIIDVLTEESENVLNTIWRITDRVVAVRRQGVDSPRIQKALDIQQQRIQNLTKAAREARENLAEWTLHGWEGRDIEKAQENLSDLVTASRELMDDSASML